MSEVIERIRRLSPKRDSRASANMSSEQPIFPGAVNLENNSFEGLYRTIQGVITTSTLKSLQGPDKNGYQAGFYMGQAKAARTIREALDKTLKAASRQDETEEGEEQRPGNPG